MENSHDVIKHLLISHQIKKVTLIVHKVGSNWSQRFTNKSMRENMLAAYTDARVEIQSHSISSLEYLSLELSDFKERFTLKSNEVVSLSSRVKIRRTYLHIPMMNFHTENGFGEKEICKAIAYIYPNNKGVLLNSGRHQHYYCLDKLLSQSEWEKFLGNFLIPFNLVHPGYIGYQLYRGFSTLRITSQKEFKPQVPKVIKMFNFD
ncbi:hypothetical protein IPM62_02570 [Candidatus Woesebacteria bacterium]|nr:MAG: hypothetical protein IPM62_02570 [Candidatus Woesebacteria bacterium]